MLIKWYHILIFVLCLAFFGVFHWPAGHAIEQAQKQGADIEAWAVNGTLKQGSIGRLVVQGNKQIDDITWQQKPWALLTLAAKYNVSAALGEGNIKGTVWQRFATTHAKDIQGIASVGDLAAVAGYAFVPVTGQTSLKFDSLRLSNGIPKFAEGFVRIGNLRYALIKPGFAVGDFEAVVATEDDIITARLKDTDGNVELSGNAQLMPDGSYTLNVQFKPKADAPQVLKNQFQTLAIRPNLQGWYEFQYSGRLNKGSDE